MRGNTLSAREETPWLGHLVAVLQLGVDLPHNCRDAKDGQARDRRVALPVVGLSVPAARRRPDVLGVSATVLVAIQSWCCRCCAASTLARRPAVSLVSAILRHEVRLSAFRPTAGLDSENGHGWPCGIAA